jgi:hypothetical protein
MQIKSPTRGEVKDAAYALAELGIAQRTRPNLWAEAQAYALAEHPDAPRRKTTGAPIWSTIEVKAAIDWYWRQGGRYVIPKDSKQLLFLLIAQLPKSGILGTSEKTKKSEAVGVENRVVYLSPAWESGIVTCPYHGICGRYCVGHSSGRMSASAQRKNRLVKTLLWHLFPDWFLMKVQAEAWNLVVEATGKGRVPAIRMNGSSDIRWENTGLFEAVPSVSWYDYTKIPLKSRGKKGQLPANYHLTFSLDETPGSWECASKYLEAGHNVAIVVRASSVADGDEHDARFKDVSGHWIVLYAKSLAAGDSEGFAYPVTKDGRVKVPWELRPKANRVRRLF